MKFLRFIGRVFGLSPTNYEETIARVIRTFLQTAISAAVSFLSTINWSNGGLTKTAVLMIMTTALSAGISAVMNLPKGGNKGEDI